MSFRLDMKLRLTAKKEYRAYRFSDLWDSHLNLWTNPAFYVILNYGTMEVTGSISLEREYDFGYSGLRRQHTVINYGALTIEGSR